MSFTETQIGALRRNLNEVHIRRRQVNGRELTFVEGWHAISEANRIFGFDQWDRETIESKCLLAREVRGNCHAVYIAKVRVTVRTADRIVVREGHGCGEGKGSSLAEAHDMGVKSAETDGTKRALATFGNPFGLSLYLRKRSKRAQGRVAANPPEPFAKIPEPQSLPVSPQTALQPDVSTLTGDAVVHNSQIDKSSLRYGHPRRFRDKAHLRFVASQPCLMCSRTPSDPHHLRFAQPRAMSMKVSDEFTVPLCRTHHRQVHQSGDEVAWWNDMDVDPLPIAEGLWNETLQRRIGKSTPAAAFPLP